LKLNKQVKNNSKVITAEDIKKHLESGDDFAFEVETYQRIIGPGFRGSFSGTYVDPVTGKSRQYDIRAEGVMDNDKPVLLAIECKRIDPEFPLVVSCVLREQQESYHQIFRSGTMNIKSGPIQRVDNMPYAVYGHENNNAIYEEGKPVGKSTTQIGHGKNDKYKESDSEFYDKWAQALSSAHDLIIKASVYQRNNNSRITYFSVIIPIVVVPNKTLWTVIYDKNGERIGAPKLVDEVEFYVGKEYQFKTSHVVYDMRYTVSHIHVLTPDGLEKFVGRISSNPKFTPLLVPDESKLNRII